MKHRFAILAAACASAFSYPVIAADEPADHIIVTGSRAPLAGAALGNALTVITRDDIERRQVRHVTDLLRSVPGFAVSQSGTPGSQTQVRVRGAEANHVLVLIDGARANDPATGDEFRWEFLSTANIERIEIVRGPQSAIWGSDALAGVVNIITRRSSGSSMDAYVETGSMGTLNGALNGGIGSDNWHVDFSAEHLSTDGSNISRSGTEDDDSDATTLSLSAVVEASEKLDLSLSIRRVDAWSQYDSVDFVATGLPADSDVALDTLQHYAHLGASYGNDDERLRQHLFLRYFDSENINLTDGVEDIAALSDRLTLSYQADLPIGKHLLSLALEHEDTAFEQRGPIGFGDPNQVQDMTVTSAIADFQGRLGDSLTVLASARYDDNSVFDNALTGRLSAAWSLDSGTVLRASAGTGRKNPTFIELYGYFPGQFINNPDLKPETSVAFDLGVEQQLGDALNLQLTLFRQDLEDEINGFVYDPVTFLSTAANMEGKSKRKGVEAVIGWTVSEHLGVNASYTYVDSQADDMREVRRPRHSGSVDIDYRFLDDLARVSLNAAYGGTRTDTFFPPWPNPPEVVTLDSHWLLDLTARYRWSPSTALFVRVSNLLDTDYEHVYGYQTPGRAAYVGVQVNVGD